MIYWFFFLSPISLFESAGLTRVSIRPNKPLVGGLILILFINPRLILNSEIPRITCLRWVPKYGVTRNNVYRGNLLYRKVISSIIRLELKTLRTRDRKLTTVLSNTLEDYDITYKHFTNFQQLQICIFFMITILIFLW